MNAGTNIRRMLIPIAVGIGLGVFVAAFLGYFAVAQKSTYWVDGLERPLDTAPWLARRIFGTNKEWAGWTWLLLDLLWFWGGISLAVFLRSLAGGDRLATSSLPKPLITITGIAIAVGAAYLTQHAIKVGVALGLESGIGFKHEVVLNRSQAVEYVPFVRSYEWSKFTEREKEIYVQALLETWSFMSYSMSDKQKSPDEFSAFTACVETEKASKFTNLVAMGYLLDPSDKPAVAHIFDKTSLICNEYINKGDRSWRPAMLIQKHDWEKFNNQERKIYLMGYIDLSHFSLSRVLIVEKSNLDQATLRFLNELNKERQELEECLNQIGIEGVFSTMSKQPIAWQHPLPWSFATALGKACQHKGKGLQQKGSKPQ